MKSILYIVAVLFFIGWVVGLMLHVAGSLIHLLLVIAVISILINIIGSRKTS